MRVERVGIERAGEAQRFGAARSDQERTGDECGQLTQNLAIAHYLVSHAVPCHAAVRCVLAAQGNILDNSAAQVSASF